MALKGNISDAINRLSINSQLLLNQTVVANPWYKLWELLPLEHGLVSHCLALNLEVLNLFRI